MQTEKQQQIVQIHVKDIQKVCLPSSRKDIVLLVAFDSVIIYDLLYRSIIKKIKRLGCCPRKAFISNNAHIIFVQFSDNMAILFDEFGRQVQNIMGVPMSTQCFKLSSKSNRIIFGNTNTFCIWNSQCGYCEYFTQKFRGINTYDIDERGNSVAIGTTSGQVYLLISKKRQNFNQLKLQQSHKACIICLRIKDNKLYSFCYEQQLVITDFSSQYSIQYTKKSFNKVEKIDLSVLPKQIYVNGNVLYFLCKNKQFKKQQEYFNKQCAIYDQIQQWNGYLWGIKFEQNTVKLIKI